MEEFLGVLFCGGRGTRLGSLTKFISKSLIPVYDIPVFKFGLNLLENSSYIKEIIILTNSDNDSLFKNTGYRTIVQDDRTVRDMFTGWNYIKKVTETKRNGVLVPSDNICKVSIDSLIDKFNSAKADFLFSLHKVKDRKKLSLMGSYDIKKNKFYYIKKVSPSNLGVIAPYIIRNDLNAGDYLFDSMKSVHVMHRGFWFDIGDHDSIIEAAKWRRKNKSKEF